MSGLLEQGFTMVQTGSEFPARLTVGCCNQFRTQDGSSRPMTPSRMKEALPSPSNGSTWCADACVVRIGGLPEASAFDGSPCVQAEAGGKAFRHLYGLRQLPRGGR